MTFALLLLMAVADVRLTVIFSYQSNGLFTALQELDAPTFWKFVGIFAVLATINLVLVLVNFYVSQLQIIRWREWLNQRMVDDWLDGAAYHRGRFVREPIDNPDQRIQEDITSYAGISQSLALGASTSVVSLVSFTIILWGLSGPLTLGGIEIPRAMVFIAYIYVIIATVIAFRIGRPLIRLNFLQERLGAYYRYALVRVRENSENVAFFRGEPVENAGLRGRFAAVIANTWAIVFRSLKFQGFNFVVNQIAVVFPLIIQAPRYFSQQITLGDVTQTGTAFGQVQGALSFFRLAYDDFAGYRAVLIRLTGLLDSNQEARALPGAATRESASGLLIHDLNVRLPDGRPLLSHLDLNLEGGSALLVKGPSGSGKTTLLRSLAGLWPHVDGSIARPGGDDALFLSQQPYLPLGSLRTALAYPEPAEGLADDDLRETSAGRPTRPPDRAARRGRPLVQDPLARRAAAPGLRPHPAGATGRALPGRGHLSPGRGHGARDVRPGPRAAPGVHDRQRRSPEHAGAAAHRRAAAARRGPLGSKVPGQLARAEDFYGPIRLNESRVHASVKEL